MFGVLYQARDVPGSFYNYEIYAGARALSEHVNTDHLKQFTARYASSSMSSKVDAIEAALVSFQPGGLLRDDDLMSGAWQSKEHAMTAHADGKSDVLSDVTHADAVRVPGLLATTLDPRE